MTSPAIPLTMRVLVKGASTANWLSYMGGPRGDLAYPRAMEAALLAAGRRAEVRDTSMAAELPKQALRDWQGEVVTWSPDVVVLHYGHMETIHRFLPVWLQRHAQSLQNRPGPIRDRYRTRVIRPAWQAMARLQQRLDRPRTSAATSRRARRVGADVEQLIRRVRTVGSPLVLVMALTAPGTKYATWFPGIEARNREMNQVLAQMVERIDEPDVRFFPTASAFSEFASPDAVNPDGLHFSPEAHRALGRALASEISTWADAQPHLNQP